jgi:protocatechuate 3,4-dioxygenase beta subunit
MAQPGYNNVTFNNITVNAETDDKIYTVNLTTANGNTVTDNTLLGVNIVGSDSVIYSGSNNKIERNAPKSIEVTMGPVVAFIGQETSIHVSVLDEDGETVQDGIVTFTDANGKVLGVADVVDGTAAINATFTKAGESTITAVFANDYTTQTVENTLTVRKAETFITIDEFNATVGEEVTITARVVDEYDNPVTNGKVVFKVNGKTLKDANGKVIYAKVTDGVATITYTVPENWKDANITAVYSGSSKYEDSKVEDVAINMTEATPALTIEPITEDITIGTQVTIKASVTGTPAPLNSGKIVFKLNGKTLKDANGKVIYAKLVNGTVTLDYTFTDLKAKTYTLSAVLISSDYDHLEDSTNVTLVE